jgi:hypothetical protein
MVIAEGRIDASRTSILGQLTNRTDPSHVHSSSRRIARIERTRRNRGDV